MENLVNPQMLSSFYSGKKVFVTGHTGFKGSWLTACLHLWNAQVKGYALPPDYSGGLYDLAGAFHWSQSILADIRDRENLTKQLLAFKPDIVFHLAAQPLVRRSYEIPAETFDVNVTGTANLLEAVTRLPSKCTVVVITTDKVYENKEQDILYTEKDALGGYDPYSASKACTELVVSSFRNSFFNPATYDRHGKAIVSVRAGNVIGGGDWSRDRIIPDIVRSLQAQKTIEVRNSVAVRPWQHVLEPLRGYLLLGYLLHHMPVAFSGAYNFGPQPADHLTVRQVVETAIEAWGSGRWQDIATPGQPHEAGLLKLDISKAQRELHWTPCLNATEAIRWTIDWYRQPVEEQVAFTLQQIRKYFSA